MDDLLEKMQAKCGIDRSTAEKVMEFLKEHAHDVTKFLGEHGVLDKLPGGLGGKLGGLF